MTTASVMTYDSLVENIQSYLDRTDADTLAKIPLFIMLAEQIIASQIKFLGNLTVQTSAMVRPLIPPCIYAPDELVQSVAKCASGGARWHDVEGKPRDFFYENVDGVFGGFNKERSAWSPIATPRCGMVENSLRNPETVWPCL